MKKVLILIAMLISTSILADSEHSKHRKHHKHTNIYNTEVKDNITNNTSVYNEYNIQSSIALAAAQHHFDYGTYALQKSVSAATLGNANAFSGAVALRKCRDCGLYSASVSLGEINNRIQAGIGVGYTWSH